MMNKASLTEVTVCLCSELEQLLGYIIFLSPPDICAQRFQPSTFYRAPKSSGKKKKRRHHPQQMVILPWTGVWSKCPNKGHHITSLDKETWGSSTRILTTQWTFVCPQSLLTSLASQLPRLPPHQSHCHGYRETTEGAPSEVRATHVQQMTARRTVST